MAVPITTGTLGAYYWVEFTDDSIDIDALVAHFARFVEGLTAINVSWDSGQMLLTDGQIAAGWRRTLGHASSPVINDELIRGWPMSSCQSGHYDEWYFVRQAGPDCGNIKPICNYAVSLAEAAALDFVGVFDLASQLDRIRPEMVIGHGAHLFVIARDPEVVRTATTLSVN